MNKMKTTPSAKLTPLHRGEFKAFTLAEILITLSIIGVVAALTIPTLIQRTGNEEAVSRLMKAYSTLSQATEAIMTENGGVKTWASSSDDVYQLYKAHLRNSKDCGTGTGCFTQSYKLFNGDSDIDWDTKSTYNRLILSDGTQAMFARAGRECNYNNHMQIGSNDVCGWIHVDINGAKGPNTIGRDAFTFVLKETGLYPAGCDDESMCASDKRGYACTCKIVREGAMNY